jgi:hypothetical protein
MLATESGKFALKNCWHYFTKPLHFKWSVGGFRQLSIIKGLNILLLIALITTSCAPATQRTTDPVADTTINPSSQQTTQENYQFPEFAQPESREAERSSYEEQNISAPANQSTPIMFIENVGQFDPRARFQVNGASATIFLSDNEIWFALLETIKEEREPSGRFGPLVNRRDQKTNQMLWSTTVTSAKTTSKYNQG